MGSTLIHNGSHPLVHPTLASRFMLFKVAQRLVCSLIQFVLELESWPQAKLLLFYQVDLCHCSGCHRSYHICTHDTNLVFESGGECLPPLMDHTGDVTQCCPVYRSPRLCRAGRATRAGEMMKGTLSLFLLVFCLAGAVGACWLEDPDLFGGRGGVLGTFWSSNKFTLDSS